MAQKATAASSDESSSVVAPAAVVAKPIDYGGGIESFFLSFAWIGCLAYGVWRVGKAAHGIRMHAINEFGPIIHEYDPYFNLRATEYLYEHGWSAFVKWFDYKVWYPLGRPVGTTIYPGMQVSAVLIKRWLAPSSMSLNDVCVYVPVWFGVSASFFTGLLAYECSLARGNDGSVLSFARHVVRGGDLPAVDRGKKLWCSPAAECGLFAGAIMAILPAHLMRSVGGGYDNESVAMTAMTATFWAWCRSLRDDNGWWCGAVAGLCYFYMAAAWGGHVFVLNLVGVHAAVLVLCGRFSAKTYKAYSLFYVVGTLLAIRIPVVGLGPLKDLEQLGPAVVFAGYQLLYYCEIQRKRRGLSRLQAMLLRVKVGLVCVVVIAGLGYLMLPSHFFGPVSARVRGLFVKHTRTGNPLVDSVAEHQPASADAYFRYLHHTVVKASLAGAAIVSQWALGDASSFLLVYGVVSYFFSSKMVRLVLLLAPIASCLSGVVIGRVVGYAWWQIRRFVEEDEEEEGVSGDKVLNNPNPNRNNTNPDKNKDESVSSAVAEANVSHAKLINAFEEATDTTLGRVVKLSVAVVIISIMYGYAQEFVDYSWDQRYNLSHPSIVSMNTMNNGEEFVMDDYREAYWWIRDNTPEDARVLAWWDYGYQISAIANRTTIADGNTWNHEHIALLGRILTSPEKEGHRIARHLADYVLIWAGGGGDDLAKSPHLARIANSVYRDMCPGDPTCRSFGVIDRHGTPSRMMRESLLYKLHGHRTKDGVEADPNRFREVYRSKHGKVIVFRVSAVSKESKAWAADPANRECDAPGSWFCPGRYPPALDKILAQKKDFAQLEDFNRRGKAEGDEDYQRRYMEHMSDPNKANEFVARTEPRREKKAKKRKEKNAQKKHQQSQPWANTETTSRMWELIRDGSMEALDYQLEVNPEVAFVRSSDGKGPLFWACEFGREEMIAKLLEAGASKFDRDAQGLSPFHQSADMKTTSRMWEIIRDGSMEALEYQLEVYPWAAFARSSDGRGPLFWAYEYGRDEMIAKLLEAGASKSDQDAQGLSPFDLRSS